MAMSLFIIVNYKEMKKIIIFINSKYNYVEEKFKKLKNCLLKMISKNLIIKMNIDIDLNYTFNIGIIFKI